MRDRGLVVVSADDFGLTAGVNRAIVDTFERSVITSTSIILGHPGSAEALELASSGAVPDLGLHINLSDGFSVSRDVRLAPLTSGDGAFLGRRRLASAAVARSIDLFGVRAEVEAQIEVCSRHGLVITHIDSHHYVHALPGIGEVVRECAMAAGVPLIRSCRWRSLLAPMASAAIGGSPFLQPMADGPDLGRSCRPGPRAASDYIVPLAAPVRGPLSIGLLERLLGSVSDCVVEIVTHPGYADRELAECSAYVEAREVELEILGSGELQRVIEASGLQLSTFREVARS